MVLRSGERSAQTPDPDDLFLAATGAVIGRRLTYDECRRRIGSYEATQRPAWLCWRCARKLPLMRTKGATPGLQAPTRPEGKEAMRNTKIYIDDFRVPIRIPLEARGATQ